MYNATEITFTAIHALMRILCNELFGNCVKQMNDEKQPIWMRALYHEICKFINAAKEVTEHQTEHTRLLTNSHDAILLIVGEIQQIKDINNGEWLDEILSNANANDDIIMFVNELPRMNSKDIIVSIDNNECTIFVLWPQDN